MHVIKFPSKEQTAKECLEEALSKCESWSRVLIIYEQDMDGEHCQLSTMDSGLTMEKANWMVDLFKGWLLKGTLG